MIINKDEHKEFSKLMEFIFSFDFSNKDILRNQIQQAVVDIQRTEYSIVHRFFVNSISKLIENKKKTLLKPRGFK